MGSRNGFDNHSHVTLRSVGMVAGLPGGGAEMESACLGPDVSLAPKSLRMMQGAKNALSKFVYP